MDYLYIYYYDNNDDLTRCCCIQVDFENECAVFRDENGITRKIPVQQIEKIKTY